MPLALSTGHEVGLGITALAFIAFALASSFLFPRVRSDYPGRGLLAFVVIAFVFFFGMLTAVEVFGAESKKGEAATPEATTAESTTTGTTLSVTVVPQQQTTTAQTTTQAATTTTAKPAETKVSVREAEFKITLGSTELKAGEITFDVKNDGKIPHDLAIKGTSDKTKEIAPGGNAELKVTLKPGKYVLYCSIPGHEQAGMKLSITVT